jgi:exonuclease III
MFKTEDKTDDVKDSFYEELERVFDKFPKYHMKILLGDFNAKVGKEDILKPTIGNESLHKLLTYLFSNGSAAAFF